MFPENQELEALMDKKPLVSVIVPTYNHSDYVIEALDSVASQTLPDLELIVLDDASSDDTFEKTGKWAEDNKDRFINLVARRNEVNKGAHATINAGLDLATGKYLTILNSDDWYASDRLEKMVKELEDAGGNFIISGVRVVDENGEEIKNDALAIYCRTLEDRIDAYPGIGFALFEKNIAITTGNIVFSRNLQKKVGYFQNLKLTHDWDFLLRCLAYEDPVYLPEFLYNYRVYTGNSFKKLKREAYLEPRVIFRKIFMNIENNNYENPRYPLYRKFINNDNMKFEENIIGKGKIKYQSVYNLIHEDKHNLLK